MIPLTTIPTTPATDSSDRLARCQALRTQALATPISNEWDEQDRATYLRHLDETEAALKKALTP